MKELKEYQKELEKVNHPFAEVVKFVISHSDSTEYLSANLQSLAEIATIAYENEVNARNKILKYFLKKD